MTVVSTDPSPPRPTHPSSTYRADAQRRADGTQKEHLVVNDVHWSGSSPKTVGREIPILQYLKRETESTTNLRSFKRGPETRDRFLVDRSVKE